MSRTWAIGVDQERSSITVVVLAASVDFVGWRKHVAPVDSMITITWMLGSEADIARSVL